MSEEKKDLEDDLTRKLYQDTILNGRFTNSKAIQDLAGKINIYGENRQIEAMLKAQSAGSIVDFIGDEEVAKGIAIGIELGKPIFEEIGEEFLKSKIPNYTKSGLGVALTRVLLNGLKGKRIEKIYKGVEDVLEGREEMSEEAKAAQIATEVYDNANKYKDQDEFRRIHTNCFSCVIKQMRTFKEGTIKYPEKLQELLDRKSDKDRIKRNPIRKNELENGYRYYMLKFDEIPEEFKKTLEGYEKQEIVAYYVASMREDKIHELYVEQTQGIEKE